MFGFNMPDPKPLVQDRIPGLAAEKVTRRVAGRQGSRVGGRERPCRIDRCDSNLLSSLPYSSSAIFASDIAFSLEGLGPVVPRYSDPEKDLNSP